MKVVVVESPAKARTINKFLGSEFAVVASFGHVRDLPAKDGSVRPDEDFAMDWSLEDRGRQRITEIAKLVRGADALYLATDPDREGEAISWHIRECLEEKKLLKGLPVRRVVFHEVTKAAVQQAFRETREIDSDLVDAYLARRALDYLVGFTLSPVLWRKLPGSRSAGRVQSVALRLVCEREAEIEAFRPREYWSVEVAMRSPAGEPFTARLVELDGAKLDKLSLANETDANAAKRRIEAASLRVTAVERKQVKRHPQPPFTTSTLQQEASRKLGFTASRTMQVAQRLYEGVDLGGETVGLISYMRTDGVQLSTEAVTAARTLIARDHGDRFLPAAPRIYKAKARNAQEAHEAIRPTDVMRRPDEVARHLEPEQLRLYDLIWKRTVASQMESAVLDQTGVDIADRAAGVGLRASGTVVVFDGFFALYQEGRDDAAEEEGGLLPKLVEGDRPHRGDVATTQHFTQPPPRFTEASLIKKLEELGIGRPSTYTSILNVLQERAYVRLDQRRFVPEDRGRLVTAFLSSFFERYVQYGFTADLEDQLDRVSDGKLEWRQLLRAFWQPFLAAVDGTRDLKISQVLDTLDQILGPHFFPVGPGGTDPRACPSCRVGRLGLRLGKTGGFIGCSNYPECRYTRALAVDSGEGAAGEPTADQPRPLGADPATGLMVSLRKGPYGIYVQLGEGGKEERPKRASLPKGLAPASVTLESALALLALPRALGVHPDSREPVTAGIGRFGPYLKHGQVYKSLPRDEDVLTIGLNRAVVLLAEEKRRPAAAGEPLGPHPSGVGEITLHDGRYGAYVQHGGVRATLPRGTDAGGLTIAAAVALLDAKAGAAPTKGRGRPSATTAAKRPAARAGAASKTKPKPAGRAKARAKVRAKASDQDPP